MKITHRITYFFIIGTLIILVDQWTKYLIIDNFVLYESKVIIKGFFDLTYLTNTGAAFGFMAGADKWRHIMFQIIGFAALGGLFYLYAASTSASRLLLWGSALVFGGAAGNLIDRIRLHKVIDFLDFHVFSYHWPAFNIADSAITTGGFLLALFFLKNSEEK